MGKPDEGEVAHWRHLLATKSRYVIGADEVGMGALAGPIFVSAVLVDSRWWHEEVKDSKRYNKTTKLTAHQKRVHVLNTAIKPAAIHMATACMSSQKLDKIGIDEAWMLLMRRVILECLQYFPDATVIVDGSSSRGLPGRVTALPKADNIVAAVSAASVRAKTARDALMQRAGDVYPAYGFETNAGYGSDEHMSAIREFGLCPLHRRSYAPIRDYLRMHPRE